METSQLEMNEHAADNLAMKESLDAKNRKLMVAYGTDLLAACLELYHAMDDSTPMPWRQIHFEVDDVNLEPTDLIKIAKGLDERRFLADTGLPLQCYKLLKQYPKAGFPSI